MKYKVFDEKTDVLSHEFTYNKIETDFLKNHMKKNKSISIDDIRRIALWKLDRVLEISEETLQNLKRIAVHKDITIDAQIVLGTIQLLTSSKGVGFPMASAILKFLRPDIFPIIDIRAYRAIYGKKITYSQYSIDKYVEYTKKLQKISADLGIELNEIDEQLYCFDKKYNGKI
ncbi:hypothetical protein [Sulfurimonas sp. HSL-1716]|uniref:hypothetical protein n=1 Tax=Hydrocurvibacter sulfurireducens TaxID=3131937 RepID=UPI0031FA0246